MDTYEGITPTSTNQVVLLTGAASGIGEAIADAFRAEGSLIFGVDKCWKSAPEGVHARQADISVDGVASELVAECVDRFGRLDALINCAGIGRGHSATETSASEWAEFLRTNLTSAFVLSQAAMPHLAAANGCIVNVASVFGMVGFPNSAGYAATKAALIGLTRQMAADYGPLGVRVNAVAPGAIETPLTRSRLQPENWHYQATVGLTPLGRAGRPAEVARPVVFLCSPQASYVHGAVLVVDGGWSATRFFPKQ